MTADDSPKPKVFLTGMKPGQNFEEFKNNVLDALSERGWFAPKPPTEASASQECDEPAKPEKPGSGK